MNQFLYLTALVAGVVAGFMLAGYSNHQLPRDQWRCFESACYELLGDDLGSGTPSIEQDDFRNDNEV